MRRLEIAKKRAIARARQINSPRLAQAARKNTDPWLIYAAVLDEKYKEDFKKALDYYSSQWQGIVDVLTKASNNKEVREGFMKELNKRMGQNKPTDT